LRLSGANPPAQSSPHNGEPLSAFKAKIDAPTLPPVNVAPVPQSTLSESKFLSALYERNCAMTPQDNALGEGEEQQAFISTLAVV